MVSVGHGFILFERSLQAAPVVLHPEVPTLDAKEPLNMIEWIRGDERGFADHGWLKSHHSFSFADYFNPRRMGFGNLRVINEDRIAAGTGFGTHPHRDMEIVSYVLEGALAHKDSIGNGARIVPGDVQRMTAGTGVRHSEVNGADSTTHFLQIWILPQREGLAPGYEQKHFDAAAKRGRLALVASPDGREGSLTLNADASIRAGLFDRGEQAELALDPARLAYVHVVRGQLQVNGRSLKAGDAAALADEPHLTLGQGEDAEVLVFDLARLER
jgi:redox-sensitive bicupin YhaK (pirin superfamily)